MRVADLHPHAVEADVVLGNQTHVPRQPPAAARRVRQHPRAGREGDVRRVEGDEPGIAQTRAREVVGAADGAAADGRPARHDDFVRLDSDVAQPPAAQRTLDPQHAVHVQRQVVARGVAVPLDEAARAERQVPVDGDRRRLVDQERLARPDLVARVVDGAGPRGREQDTPFVKSWL